MLTNIASSRGIDTESASDSTEESASSNNVNTLSECLSLFKKHIQKCFIIFIVIRHVNEYPTMHHFGNPGHTQSMIAYDFD